MSERRKMVQGTLRGGLAGIGFAALLLGTTAALASPELRAAFGDLLSAQRALMAPLLATAIAVLVAGLSLLVSHKSARKGALSWSRSAFWAALTAGFAGAAAAAVLYGHAGSPLASVGFIGVFMAFFLGFMDVLTYSPEPEPAEAEASAA